MGANGLDDLVGSYDVQRPAFAALLDEHLKMSRPKITKKKKKIVNLLVEVVIVGENKLVDIFHDRNDVQSLVDRHKGEATVDQF